MENKRRLVLIMDYLKENSNEHHKVTSEEMMAFLSKNHGITSNRKTIYSDINALISLGFNIEKSNQGFYWEGSIFDVTELRILIDAIKACGFLSMKKTKMIIDKLSLLCNKYDRQLVEEGSYYNIKTTNEKVLYNIYDILLAIENHQMITFKYFDIGINKKKIYRNHEYRLFPLDLLIHHGRYYVVCYSKKYDCLNNYRIDKLERIRFVDEFIDKFDFDVNEYMQQTFNMFVGEKKNVILKCDSSLLDEIYARFGENVIITAIEDNQYYFSTVVSSSESFFAWLFSYNGKITIISPNEIKEEFVSMCKKAIELNK